MVDRREQLRRAGLYVQADQIRADLLAEGIVVQDQRDGPARWHESIWGPGGRDGHRERRRREKSGVNK